MTWTIRRASEDTGRIAARCAGAGPSVVLIHGVGLCAKAWESVAQRLSGASLHLVDMPGHGASPWDGAAALEDYVARIGAYVARLDGPVCLAGHSMGAMIATELAATMPQKIRAVAALNAVFRRTQEAAGAVRARAAALPADAPSDPTATLLRWFGEAPRADAARASDRCRHWLSTVDPQAYKAAYLVFAQHDGPSEGQLQGLTCPALFLTGAGDPNSTPAMSRAMAALAPQGRAEVLAGAAHMLPMTHPAQTAALLAGTFGLPGTGA